MDLWLTALVALMIPLGGVVLVFAFRLLIDFFVWLFDLRDPF